MLSCYALRKVAIGTRCASGERFEGSQFLSLLVPRLGYQCLEGESILHGPFTTVTTPSVDFAVVSPIHFSTFYLFCTALQTYTRLDTRQIYTFIPYTPLYRLGSISSL